MKIKVEYLDEVRYLEHRVNSLSDQKVIFSIFNQNAYHISQFKQSISLYNFYIRHIKDGAIPLIIDAGANIGASSVWFSIVYPIAKIVAIEPERGNIDLLKNNVNNMSTIICEGAIGSHSGTMYLYDPGYGDWAFRVVKENVGNKVKVFSGEEIMMTYLSKQNFPFILKIDIEGGEDDLFSSNTKWIESFALIIIEIHDWMIPGKSNSKSFFKFIGKGDYDIVTRGENIFAFNTRLLNK